MKERRYAICQNPECRYQGQPRIVFWPYLGDGLYFQPEVICECGRKVTIQIGEESS